jgi:hypothetical protein
MNVVSSQRTQHFGKAALGTAVAIAIAIGCSSQSSPAGGGGGAQPGGGGANAGSVSNAGNGGAASTIVPSNVIISVAANRPVTTTRGGNYWDWSPTYGDDVTGTDSLVQPLKLSVLRMGGYNNDANLPDPFDDAQLDRAVAYARAIGAQPLIQVPLLADTSGMPPTAATARAMVTYANVTKGYGVKYFSIGNEPDLYPTQGGLQDITAPAIPDYTPDDYCASATADATQMKNADPSIQIVGPDLAWHFVAGNDWLTPILQKCGSVFDIISIHRYPFSATVSTLPSVSADAVTFQSAVKSVQAILKATGFSATPLALTEMNVAYDAKPASNVPIAGNGTVPSALWVADILGESSNLGLWTTAIWDLSDADDWSTGLISPPPARTPRPEYYTYSLFADHMGPTLVDVSSMPSGVRAYATRNAADSATEVIAVNWNTAPSVLSFQVTDLSPAPPAAVYTMPAVSLAAVEIPDTGSASALIYGGAQFAANAAPQPLAPGVMEDTGTGGMDGANDKDAGDASAAACVSDTLPTAAITVTGSVAGTALDYGSAGDRWASFNFAGSGEPTLTSTLTTDGNGFSIAANLVTSPVMYQNYVGFGLYYDASTCIDATAYSGVSFDLSGDLGSCALTVAADFSGDLSTADDAVRGACVAASCYPPSAPVTPGTGTVKVPFSAMTGGVPVATVDVTTLSSLTWQLNLPNDVDGGACAANFSVKHLTFY